MTIFNDEQVIQLKELGYKITAIDTATIIRRRSRIPLLIMLIGSVLGVFFIIYNFGENQIYLLGVLLIFAPLLYYRSNVANMILLDRRNGNVEYRLGYFSRKRSKNMSNIDAIILDTYDFMGSVSPFKEGHRDYYADVKIKWNDGKLLEVFHFSGRSADQLSFAKQYQSTLNEHFKLNTVANNGSRRHGG